MAPRFNILLLALSFALPAALRAQSKEAIIEQEHRYQFTLNGEMSLYQEKVLVEQMSFSDARMRVDIDRPQHLMKVLSYRPIDPQSVVELAAQQGLSIAPRRRYVDPSPLHHPQQ